MSAEPTVSIVVPVYNVERYLQQCLDSILGQTYADFEVLAIDDGSKDSSARILEACAEKDARVRVISKPNGGYGSAVNAGLEQAVGTWVSIIEPDDFIGERFLEDLMDNAFLEGGGTPDIVKSSFWFYFDECDEFEEHVESPLMADYMPGFRCETTAAESPDLVRQHPSIWTALYRRDFLEKHGIRMRELPGAGWADNPWMVDTMLRAERIVWIPIASYYYRQTNEGSSTRLSDFRLPFDRLRDMRAIYEELGVTDSRLIDALYSRTLTYVNVQVLFEGGFSEADEKLQGLIREAFSSMDRADLLSTGNLISRNHKDYYRDFMGIKLGGVRTRSRSEKPFFSVLLPLKDDREGLWKTAESLFSQNMGEFEVICVDCESHDRSASIVRDIAQRDGRFVLLPGQVGTYSEGWVRALEAARAPYVLPLVSGAEFKGSGYLSGVRDALETTDAVAADIVVAESDLSHVRKGRMEPVPSAFHYYAPKRREHIAAVSSPFVYGKCFNAAFLRAHAEALATCEDIDGVDVWAQMLARAEFVSLLSSAPVEAEYRIPVLIKLGRTGEGLVRMCTDRYERLASLLGASGEGEHAPAMAILFNLMAHDLETLIYEREGMRLQQAITKLFAGEGGYGEEVPLDVRATDGFRFLDQATHCSYGQLVSLYALQRRKEHRKFVQRVQSSAFYRTEEAAKSFVKRNAPKSVMRMLTGH